MFRSLVKYISALLNSWNDNNIDITITDTVGPDDRIEYSFEIIDDFPESIRENMIYIVGEKDHEWLAVLKCPCGCGDTVQLNLLKDAKPFWEIIRHKNGLISISPSINRIVNCKSHFSIIKEKVWWWGEWWETDDQDI
jgi:hypothetical protein